MANGVELVKEDTRMFSSSAWGLADEDFFLLYLEALVWQTLHTLIDAFPNAVDVLGVLLTLASEPSF